MVSRYVHNGPVKQDLCLLPPPPHYRVIPPPRADGYTVSTPAGSYVQAPANQGGNQGPGSLRGLPPSAVPPSSTPPNADLKVQALPPQSTINTPQLMFSQTIRPTQQFFPRPTAPSSQNQRMASHNNRPQQMFHQPHQIYPIQQQQMFISSIHPYNGSRQQNYVQTMPIYAAPPYPYSFNPQQNQQPTMPLSSPYYDYYNTAAMVPRTTPIPTPQTAAPNPAQATIPIPMVQNNTQHAPQKQTTIKRRQYAMKIIDPQTGVDKLEEVLAENSHPPSGESSARQTPQPGASQNQKEVQAAFAKQVLQAINTGVDSQQRLQDDEKHHHHHHPHHQPHTQMQAPPPNNATNNSNLHQPSGHPHLNQDGGDLHSSFQPTNLHHHTQPHVEHQQIGQYPPAPQQPQQVQVPPHSAPVVASAAIITSSSAVSSNVPSAETNMDHILNAMAKEFVSSSSNINVAKETTPVVSANCDAEEKTIHPKQHKDRESPVKGRKVKEHLQQKISSVASTSITVPSTSEYQQQVERTTSSNNDEKPPTVSVEGKKLKDINSSTTTNISQVISKDVIPEEISEPKKIQKKDNKPESKFDVGDFVEPQALPPPSGGAQDLTNAKTKQNARNASKQGGQQQTAHQQQQQNVNQKAAAPVPHTQPPKTSNKSHKKIDINQKGANKEGTDMDAFNDNLKETVTANNAITNSTVNDIKNANSLLTNNVSSGIANNNNNNKNSINTVNNEINKKLDSNDTSNTISNTTIKPSSAAQAANGKPKTNRVDVTSIVREQPKMPTRPLPPRNINSTDETDRAAPSVDMLNANNSNKLPVRVNMENKLPYKEDQWTPDNPNGLKIYEKDFLLALRNSPHSKIKPDQLLDNIVADERRLDGRASMGGRTDSSNTQYAYGGNKSSSQRGLGPKRNSSQSKQGPNNKNVKPPAKVSISLREDVKLHEVENAWRPARFIKGETATDEDRKTEELYKKVRGILNKLTPQKFDTLLDQIKSLQIVNSDRLQGVIDLVFDKAVDEPNFSVAYARMCKELALMGVPTVNSTKENPEVVNFRKLLLTRCQMEFEKQSVDESIRNTKLKEIEECADVDKKKDLQFDLEEYDRKLRMKSVGNVRFIGELFKQQMLTQKIMVKCLGNLIDHKDEESLECLCKLLTTIGKELENKGINLIPMFTTMKSIAEKKDGKITSRIRFMLQDVIDLKQSKWVPRRQDLNPKTIDQIQKEAEREQLNIQMMNSVPASRKDDRVGSGGAGMGMNMNSMDRKGGRGGRVMEDGWVLNQRNRTSGSSFSVQSDKLKNKAPLMDEPLGSMQFHAAWGKGSQGAKSSSQQITNTSNMYSALENNSLDSDKRLGPSRPKDAYSSKGPSLERNYGKYEGRGSRSGSQHRSSNDSSSTSSSQRSTPGPMLPPMGASTTTGPAKMAGPPPTNAPIVGAATTGVPIGVPSLNSITPTSLPVIQLTEEQLERRINNGIDEYLSGNLKLDEYFQEICSCVSDSFSKVIFISYRRVLEKKDNDRLKTGELFAKLVKQGQIHLEDYCAGLQEILNEVEDLKLDVPKIWDYLAEMLLDMISEESLPLSRLNQLCKTLEASDISKLLTSLFKLIVSKKGPYCLQHLWLKSGLKLTDFLDSSSVNSFIKDNQFEFLLEGSAVLRKDDLSFEQIQEHLSGMLAAKASHDEIFVWIKENVGERVKEGKFIRALATAIFQDSISENNKLQTNVLTQHNNLMLRYIDNNSNYELEGLYALQALVHKLEHPKGLLLSFCSTLLDSLMFSQESFVTWEQSDDPAEQEGKGVALKQLTAFICQLRENDDEDTSGEEA